MKNKKMPAGKTIVFFLAALFLRVPLSAQTTAVVTTNAGDSSAGSLGAAVSIINNQGPGAITFQFAGSGVITLTSVLPISLTQSVTLQGLAANLIGQDNNLASLKFQQNLTQASGDIFTLTNNGANSSGLDASVTAQSWSLNSSAGASIGGGAGAGVVTLGSNGAAGGDGGKSSVAASSLSLGTSAFWTASGGMGGVGGSGDPGNLGGAGGGGGSVSMALGSLLLDISSSMTLTGGAGGNGGIASGGTGGAGGDGGNLFLTADSVTLNGASLLEMDGGAAGLGGASSVNGATGSQGNASVSIGSLNGTGGLNLSGNTAALQVAAGTYSGDINGNTGLEKIGAGALTISGFNQYTGGTTISSGTLSVDTGGVLGSGTVLNNSTLVFVNNASALSLNIQNNSALMFNGNATAGNAAVTNNLLVNFTGNSTAGAATLVTNNFATLSFGGSSQGGSARVIVNSGGTFSLGSHSGALTLGSIEGMGYFDLGANHLAVGVNNMDSAVGGTVSGTGGLDKIGTGTLFLVGTGINDYSGGTLLSDGILAVGKVSALGTGSVVVSGGTLETVGGALSFNIGGNYSQGSLGKLQVGLGGSDAASSDLMAVSGAAALNGTLSLADYGALTAPALGQSVTVMTASSVNGRFQTVDQSFVGMRFLPLYHNNSLALLSVVPSFAGVGLTPNQKAVGGDLDRYFGEGAYYDLMLALGSQASSSLNDAFDQISPEAYSAYYYSAFQTARRQSSLAGRRLDQLRTSRSNRKLFAWEKEGEAPRFAADLPAAVEASMVTAPPRDGWEVFLDSGVESLSVLDDLSAAGFKMSTFGVIGAGMDHRLDDHLAAGFLAGYGHSDVSPSGGGSLKVDGDQLGLYGTWFSGIFYANLFAMGGLTEIQSQRVGFGGTALGSSSGTEWSGSLELGCQWKRDEVSVGPWVSTQWTQANLNAFTETGSLAPLSLPAQSADSFLGQVGLKAEGRWKAGNMFISPTFSAAWEHEFNFQGGLVQSGLGSAGTFAAAGPLAGPSGFVVGAGIRVGFSPDFNVTLNYQGELGRTNLDSQQFSGGLSFGL